MQGNNPNMNPNMNRNYGYDNGNGNGSYSNEGGMSNMYPPMDMGGQGQGDWNNQMMYPMMGGMYQNGYGNFPYIPPAGPQNYKTKICRHYRSGKCKLAGLCNFAHGDEELRTIGER